MFLNDILFLKKLGNFFDIFLFWKEKSRYALEIFLFLKENWEKL